MKRSPRKTIRNKLDAICSKIVRSHGQCVACRTDRYDILQCAHIISRANLATRWDMLNLLCLCAGCHWRAHKDPLWFASFVRDYLSFDYETLMTRKTMIKKWTMEDLKALYLNYVELERNII